MSDKEASMTPVLLWMALFVIVGAPFVYLIWEFINEILSGQFDPATAGLALVGIVGAVFVLKLVARRAAAWEDGSG